MAKMSGKHVGINRPDVLLRFKMASFIATSLHNLRNGFQYTKRLSQTTRPVRVPGKRNKMNNPLQNPHCCPQRNQEICI